MSGGIAFGSISRVTIHHQSLAAQSRSLDELQADDIDRHRSRQAENLVESRIAIVRIRTGSAEPSTDRITNAKISVGHRQQQVDKARQQLVDPASRNRGGEARR